jgi:hypothetical protein
MSKLLSLCLCSSPPATVPPPDALLIPHLDISCIYGLIVTIYKGTMVDNLGAGAPDFKKNQKILFKYFSKIK